MNGIEKLASSVLSLSHTHSPFLSSLSFFFTFPFIFIFPFLFLFPLYFCCLSSTPSTNWSSKTKNGFDFKQVRGNFLSLSNIHFFSKIFWQNISISLLSSLSPLVTCLPHMEPCGSHIVMPCGTRHPVPPKT